MPARFAICDILCKRVLSRHNHGGNTRIRQNLRSPVNGMFFSCRERTIPTRTSTARIKGRILCIHSERAVDICHKQKMRVPHILRCSIEPEPEIHDVCTLQKKNRSTFSYRSIMHRCVIHDLGEHLHPRVATYFYTPYYLIRRRPPAPAGQTHGRFPRAFFAVEKIIPQERCAGRVKGVEQGQG